MSSWVMEKPCEGCPFRKDGGVKLHRGRVEEIAEGLQADMHFNCHATIDYRDAEEGIGAVSKKTRHCYGAARLLLLEKMPNQLMRIAMRVRGLDPEKILAPCGVRMAESFEEFREFATEEGHAGNVAVKRRVRRAHR
jgi:hypothetical protein